jgi:hypothetical protein
MLLNWYQNRDGGIRRLRTKPEVLRHTPTTSISLDEGISQRDLCDRFGISPANVGARAKRKNLNTVAFLKQETGWRYVGKL